MAKLRTLNVEMSERGGEVTQFKEPTKRHCRACDIVYPIEGTHSCPASIRTFDTGATRDTDQGKLDFEGFLSPHALEAFATYMQKHQVQSDGSLRSSDNWQKGIPVEAYMKSAWRHFFAVWKGHRTGAINMDDLCALFFNVQGVLHEHITKGDKK